MAASVSCTKDYIKRDACKMCRQVFGVTVKMQEAKKPEDCLSVSSTGTRGLWGTAASPSSPVFLATGITKGKFHTNQPTGSNACCRPPA